MASKRGDYWMQEASERMERKGTKGKLRKRLHVKAGDKIPAKKLKKAAHSKNPELKREAVLAETFKKASHSRGRKKSRKRSAIKR